MGVSRALLRALQETGTQESICPAVSPCGPGDRNLVQAAPAAPDREGGVIRCWGGGVRCGAQPPSGEAGSGQQGSNPKGRWTVSPRGQPSLSFSRKSPRNHTWHGVGPG